MRDVADWIERYRAFWDARLDSLADYLERTNKSTKEKPSGGKNG
jgi:hypothetical protein